LGWQRFIGAVTGCCSVLVFFGQELQIAYTPGAVTRTHFQSFDLPRKLG
jgi:hypothetical protein